MPHLFRKTATAIALSALAIAPLAAGATPVTADAAYANPGKGNANGNGKSNGNGKGREKSAANRGGREDVTRGRGQIASELGALNAAHASQTALENASPDSMPGKLFAYQQSGGISVDGINAYNEAKTAKEGLKTLTDAEKQALYDDYVASLDEGDEELSQQDFLQALVAEQDAILGEYQDAYVALARLKDGSLSLSSAALNELNAMLGITD